MPAKFSDIFIGKRNNETFKVTLVSLIQNKINFMHDNIQTFLAKKQQTINAKNKIEYITLHIKRKEKCQKVVCTMFYAV